MIGIMLEVLKVLVPLLVGLFAGWVATRNARKTPHDNLKALVDINSSLADGMDPDGIVETAMRRELRRLDRINRSREGSFAHFVWVQIQNNIAVTAGVVAIALGFTGVLIELVPEWLARDELQPDSMSLGELVGVTLAAVVSLAVTIMGAYQAFQNDRGIANLVAKSKMGDSDEVEE